MCIFIFLVFLLRSPFASYEYRKRKQQRFAFFQKHTTRGYLLHCVSVMVAAASTIVKRILKSHPEYPMLPQQRQQK